MAGILSNPQHLPQREMKGSEGSGYKIKRSAGTCIIFSYIIVLPFAILIIRSFPNTLMAPPKKRGGKKNKPLIDTLPELLVRSLAGNDDFILTFERDPDTGKKMVHVFTGKYITPCMLRKLAGQAISREDEGCTMTSREWT
jgi:hypothetical protein